MLAGGDLLIAGENDSDETDGVVYGLTAGYDVDLGGAVFGIEGEISDSTMGAEDEDILEDGDSAELSVDRDLYLGARLGAGVGGNLFYVKAGYTNVRLKFAYDDGTTSLSEGYNIDGFRLGGGVELPVASNFAVRLEYRYSNYGELNIEDIDTELSASRHQGVIALIGKF